ncbi:copper chaperone PCu(A)C [Parvibium lacunae]|uniref:Copper chaperone PCu(A)C n=2 Tax=Parvibium lacunae TaxID=1888893 RepID=A0A368L8H1_9BURK|nr:copper chaperone PCu(A)C [Parvibium lacunae]
MRLRRVLLAITAALLLWLIWLYAFLVRVPAEAWPLQWRLSPLSVAHAAPPVLDVQNAWVRATVNQQKATGAFMTLKATQPLRLIGVESSLTKTVEVHEMAMDGNVMRMRRLAEGLTLPAGTSVELKPGGYHIMLMDLKQAVQEGQVIPLTLIVEGADKKPQRITVQATARPLQGAAMQHHAK